MDRRHLLPENIVAELVEAIEDYTGQAPSPAEVRVLADEVHDFEGDPLTVAGGIAADHLGFDWEEDDGAYDDAVHEFWEAHQS